MKEKEREREREKERERKKERKKARERERERERKKEKENVCERRERDNVCTSVGTLFPCSSIKIFERDACKCWPNIIYLLLMQMYVNTQNMKPV